MSRFVNRFDSNESGGAEAPVGLDSSSLHQSLADEAGTVLMLSAASGVLVDLAGNLTGWGAGRTPEVTEVISNTGALWFFGDGQGSTSDPEFVSLGDLVVRVKVMVMNTSPAGNAPVAMVGGPPATNTAWDIYFPNGTTIGYFHESASGTDHFCAWNLPSALTLRQLMYFNLRRVDNGDNTVTVQLWLKQGSGAFQKLSLASVTSGTDNGDGTATFTKPVSAGSPVLGLLNFPNLAQEWQNTVVEFLHVKEATTTDGAESAICQAVMGI